MASPDRPPVRRATEHAPERHRTTADADADRSPHEARLLAAVADRDRDTFEALIDRHSHVSWSLARSMCDAATARAVVIDVFGQLRRHPELAAGDPDILRDHVIRRTHRTAVAALRGSGPRPSSPAGDDPAAELDPSAECVRLARTLDPAMVRRLDALPTIEREIIVLAYLGAYTCPELSARFDRTPTEVARSIRHGLAELRTHALASCDPATRTVDVTVDAGRNHEIVVDRSGELARRAERGSRSSRPPVSSPASSGSPSPRPAVP